MLTIYIENSYQIIHLPRVCEKESPTAPARGPQAPRPVPGRTRCPAGPPPPPWADGDVGASEGGRCPARCGNGPLSTDKRLTAPSGRRRYQAH